MSERCARCGRPAQGYAFIDSERLCHGDGLGPTCYEQASWDKTLLDTGEIEHRKIR